MDRLSSGTMRVLNRQIHLLSDHSDPDDLRFFSAWNALTEAVQRRSKQNPHSSVTARPKFPRDRFSTGEFTFDFALNWFRLRGSIVDLLAGRSTVLGFSFKKPISVVESARDFRDLLAATTSEVALLRAVHENEVDYPKFWEVPCPSYRFVKHLNTRVKTYESARTNALRILSRILGINNLLDRADPVAVARMMNFGFAGDGHGHEPWFLEAIRSFITQRVLTRFEKALGEQPSVRSRYRGLPVWLADNAPVFDWAHWRWKDIHSQALEMFGTAPATPQALNRLAYKWKCLPSLPQGNAPRLREEGRRLLTPGLTLIPAQNQKVKESLDSMGVTKAVLAWFESTSVASARRTSS